jgi:sterol desaturase/sphingolipid hydroxylase (fatty acid hydroxylase superfamily)
MTGWILAHEAWTRLSFFIGVLLLMAVWEWLAPRRARAASRSARWKSHLLLSLLNTSLIRIVLPAGAVGVALLAERQGWGLFHYYDLPYALAVVASVIVLDIVIYLQHVMFHAVPLFWRLHRTHHADLDFDVTTGIRFHPAEILLSMLIKAGAILLLGAPALAVLVFEVLLNATSMFNHGNVRLPRGVDRWLRWLVVTPEMHRVHHSIAAHETNSNFGFNLPWWDRLCGTYKAQPDAGHEAMTIGLDGLRNPREVVDLPGVLAIPFRGAAGAYPINRERQTRPARSKNAGKSR